MGWIRLHDVSEPLDRVAILVEDPEIEARGKSASWCNRARRQNQQG